MLPTRLLVNITKKAEIRCIIDAWRCLGPNAGLDNTDEDKQVWWLIGGAASKVKGRGFSNALPILEQLGIDAISLTWYPLQPLRELQHLQLWLLLLDSQPSSLQGSHNNFPVRV